MPAQTRVGAPGPDDRSFRCADGVIIHPPLDWVLVPPGDAAVTRRLKAAGPTWTMQEKKGRKTFSRGVWAPQATLESIERDLAAERASPTFARKRQADAARRDREQAAYTEDFNAAVVAYLAFHPSYADLSARLAKTVADHATPVGSGTVARTKRIPIEQRAEAAVIAWMRHQTTGYDSMPIPRVKGKRREVRRQLAARSKSLLAAYRSGGAMDAATCPLQRALAVNQGPAAKATRDGTSAGHAEKFVG